AMEIHPNLKGWNQHMTDFLDTLARDAEKTVGEGYYVALEGKHKPRSLKKAILEFNYAPIIAEIKLASPSLGLIREDTGLGRIASSMRDGGAVAISVLTEPKNFGGSLGTFIKVRKSVELPLLMKDIIIKHAQIDTAFSIGADAILLIKALFDRGYCECDISDMIEYAHSKGLEVLLEAHTEDEFSSALDTESDIVGINNRDLRTLKVNINITRRILRKVDPKRKVVVSESGIMVPQDIRLLHSSGAQAFLVGSAIMAVDDIEGKVRELVTAL
ncbi:unnamed protein product, partial [marine sediment metagenome]